MPLYVFPHVCVCVCICVCEAAWPGGVVVKISTSNLMVGGSIPPGGGTFGESEENVEI